MEYIAPIILLVLIALLGLMLLGKPTRNTGEPSNEDAQSEEAPSVSIQPDPSNYVIPAGKYPSDVDPMDPRGDGTIRPGDEMWEIFQMTLQGNAVAVMGSRHDNGDVEVQVIPSKDVGSDDEVKKSPEKF